MKKKKPIQKKKAAKKPAPKKKEHIFDNGIDRAQLVLALTLQTASLELAKHEFIELAPLPGMCGPFKLSGNSLPVFEYRVFDPRKKPFMMEFVKVRVEVSKPDRIHYIAKIDSEGSQDPARHGEEVEVLPKYKEPFEKLSQHLFGYFPYFANGIKNVRNWATAMEREACAQIAESREGIVSLEIAKAIRERGK